MTLDCLLGGAMKRIIILLLLVFAAWKGYGDYRLRQAPKTAPQELADAIQTTSPVSSQREAESVRSYECDGRIHCSQMTSCEEAKFFLNNCPGTKMDGDNDGIPCEQQWCN